LNFENKSNISNATLTSKVSLEGVFNPSAKVSSAALDLYKQGANVVSAFSNKIGDNNSVTSKNVYIDDKIKFALSNPVKFMDLDLYEFVNVKQGAKIKNLNVTNIANVIMTSRKGIDDVLVKGKTDTNENEASKQLFDFLIQSNNLSIDRLNSLDYYTPIPVSGFLNTLSISTDFTLSSKFLSENLIARVDLFTKENPDVVEETLKFNLKTNDYLEAYYAELSPISLFSTKNIFDSESHRISLKASCSAYDNKILSYNLYVKNMLNSDKNFSFLANIREYEEFIDLRASQEAYFLCYRAKPITLAGEANIFADSIVVNDKNFASLSSIEGQFFNVVQNDLNSINIHLELNKQVKFSSVKIYKRNVTNSPYNDYKVFLNYSSDNSIIFNFQDVDVITGNFYEYYAELLDSNDNIIKITRPQIIEIRHINLNSHQVVIDNLNSSNGNVQFSINTKKIKSDTQYNFLKSSAEQFKITDDQSVTSLNSQDYQEIAYHKITRIDTLTSDKQSFKIVKDGLFIDDTDSRKLSNVSELIHGRLYQYQIESFKRDPITLTKDFIVTGKENGGWFYKPAKWNSPSVFNTGILNSENDQMDLELSNSDIFLSDYIGTTTLEANYFSEPVASSISPVAFRLTRNFVKIDWNYTDDKYSNLYDCYIVVKCVNGKKEIISTVCSNYAYHRLQESDIGTIFYEVTPVKKDYNLSTTSVSNELLVLSNLMDKI